MSLNKTTFAFLATIACILLVTIYSCKKSQSEDASSTSSKTLKVENGILVFPDWNSFSRALDSINRLPDVKKDQWEMSLGFKSARTKYNEVQSKLEAIENKTQYQSALDAFKDDIVLKGDEVTSAIGNAYYRPVVNEKGIVQVGPDYYRFYNDMETII